MRPLFSWLSVPCFVAFYSPSSLISADCRRSFRLHWLMAVKTSKCMLNQIKQTESSMFPWKTRRMPSIYSLLRCVHFLCCFLSYIWPTHGWIVTAAHCPRYDFCAQILYFGQQGITSGEIFYSLRFRVKQVMRCPEDSMCYPEHGMFTFMEIGMARLVFAI